MVNRVPTPRATPAQWASAGIVLALAMMVTAGCGAAGQPSSHAPGPAHPDPAVSQMSARMRAETAQSTRSLARGAAQEHLGSVIELGAAFVACRIRSTEL